MTIPAEIQLSLILAHPDYGALWATKLYRSYPIKPVVYRTHEHGKKITNSSANNMSYTCTELNEKHETDKQIIVNM